MQTKGVTPRFRRIPVLCAGGWWCWVQEKVCVRGAALCAVGLRWNGSPPNTHAASNGRELDSESIHVCQELSVCRLGLPMGSSLVEGTTNAQGLSTCPHSLFVAQVLVFVHTW